MKQPRTHSLVLSRLCLTHATTCHTELTTFLHCLFISFLAALGLHSYEQASVVAASLATEHGSRAGGLEGSVVVMHGLSYCWRFFSSWGNGGHFVAVGGFLVECGLSSCCPGT